jgi:enoyl-CoA hydratase/carnithine racemase
MGMTYFLANNALGPEVGLYIALTAAFVSGSDMMAMELAEYYVEDVKGLKQELLLSDSNSNEVLSRFSVELRLSTESYLSRNLEEIKTHFSKASVEDIFQSLAAGPETQFTKKALSTLQKMCPLALLV